jgi:predicted small metal-binding protein
MVKEIRCINAGFEDCEFLIRSEDEDEVVEFAQQHAERTHDTSASRDHIEKIMQDV